MEPRVEASKPVARALENTFVAILRELNGEMKTPAFPVRRKFRDRALDAIAIGAHELHKRFGKFHAVKGINIEVAGDVWQGNFVLGQRRRHLRRGL